VSSVRSRGPIVIDTDVFSADRVPGSRLVERYAPLITGRLAFISFQTAAELPYGGIRRGWGQPRMLRMEAKIERVEVVQSGPELVAVYAQHREDSARLERRNLPRCPRRQARDACIQLTGSAIRSDIACTRLVPAPDSSAVSARFGANIKVPFCGTF
jgi:hypothetical protein